MNWEMAEWISYWEWREKEVVSFETGLTGYVNGLERVWVFKRKGSQVSDLNK